MVEQGGSPYNRERVVTERNGHITDMTLPSGGLRIIYENHGKRATSIDIPTGTKGIFVEVTNPPRDKNELAKDIEKGSISSEITTYAAQNRIPLYFHDIGYSDRVRNLRYAAMATKMLVEPLAAIPLFATSNTLREGVIKSAPLIYDSLGFWANSLISSDDPDIEAKTARLIIQSHPYMFPISLRLRNAIWATKLNWALDNDLGEHFTTIVGNAHVGLEKYVKKVSEGMQPKILGATHSRWGKIGNLTPFYSITRFLPNKSNGTFRIDRVFEVPELKALAGVASRS